MGLIDWCKNIATLGPVGYWPAPGTSASAIVFLVLFFLTPFFSDKGWLLVTALIIVFSFVVISYVQKKLNWGDPSQIVIDELVGSCVAVIALPRTIPVYVIAFLLFRFFDIYKPWPINISEKAPGANGVLLDDIIAGSFTNSLLRIGLFVCLSYIS